MDRCHWPHPDFCRELFLLFDPENSDSIRAMSDAPQGTVTFLFTDIVGSTRLWEKFPLQMGAALARHDAIMRAAAAAQRGYVFKTVGDAFCVAFPSPRAALLAAIAAQRGLAAENWNETGPIAARMGLHTGAAEFRENDYFGGTLNRAARIEAAAHGGQILLSQVVHDLLEDDPLDGASFRPLGSHHLRNLARPENLFQAVVPGLPDNFPPPRSMEVLPNNLPAQTTSFLGRDQEMEEVRRRLQQGRLATLTGSGGSGKTRLALETGARLIHEFRDGVWLVEFALIDHADRVVESVASVVGARAEAGRPLRESLLHTLRNKELLLILDNCEHVQAAASSLVFDLLRSCPKLKVLATSRQNLGLSGEAVFPVPPLGILDSRLNDLSGPNLAERLTQYSAVKLFIERALAVRPDFTVTNANAPALAEICSRLDGNPLAIELAAARARVLDLHQIAERLDDRFRLLRTGSRAGALPHQQTLQALIDWSHDLLSDSERILFRRLGAFVGGRTIEALEAVCSGNGLEDFEILDLLQQLADKSLVTVERSPSGPSRYTLLESVWQYSRDKLVASGEEAAVRDRHLAYFLQLAETAAPHLEGARQKEWLDRSRGEAFNIRSAVEWAIRSRQPEPGFRLITAGCRFIEIRGNLAVSREYIRQLLALDHSAVPLPRQAAFFIAAGRIAWAADDHEDSRAFHAQAQRLFESLGDEAGAALALAFQGFLDRGEGQFAIAEERFRHALAVGRKLSHSLLEALGLSGLGNVALSREDLPQARELLEAALAIYEPRQDYWTISLGLWSLAFVAIAQKDRARAESALAEWTRHTRDLGNRWALPYILAGHAALALDAADPHRATRYFAASDALLDQLGARLAPREKDQHDLLLARIRAALPPAEFAQAWEAGRNTPVSELIPES